MAIKTEVVDKSKAANEVCDRLEKRFGKGIVLKLGSRVGVPMPHNPTGIYSVDKKVLGIGGFPKGRVIEIFGTEAGGKTTITLQMIAQAQRRGGQAAFIDLENAIDPNWAKTNGVDVDNLFLSQPDCGEDALEITQALIESEAYDIVVIDSVAALVPRAELEGEMGDSHVGLQARLMSQALRKLTHIVNKSSTSLVFINQIREKIGVTYGSNETTAGGRALRFYASVRLDVRRIGQVKKGEEIIGSRVKLKAVKNKTYSPFREAEVDLLYGYGFDAIGDVLENAVATGIVDKSGSWYSYQGTQLEQGKAGTVALLRDDTELYDRIYKELLNKE